MKLNVPGFLFQTRQTCINASSQIHVCSYSCEQLELYVYTQRDLVALTVQTAISASSHCPALAWGTGPMSDTND